MIQKDLNFFTVYKNNSAKNGSGLKGIIALVIVFVLLVGLTFGGLFFFKIIINGQVNAIKQQLQAPSVIEAQTKLAKEITKNDLMGKYKGALTIAKKSFDKTRFIDNTLLSTLTSCVPADAIITSLTINALTITISSSCTDKLSAAAFCQALEAKSLFSSVTYGGINKDSKTNVYTFDIICTYKEEVSSK